MDLRKSACLLLTLAFVIMAVPAYAGGNPPPTGGGNIHPWDNNDGQVYTGGPLIVHSGWMWLGYGFSGRLIWLPGPKSTGPMKSDKSGSEQAIRKGSVTLETAVRNR
jgi:hypothetical protein